MNTTAIIASLIALIGGFLAGSNLSETTPTITPDTNPVNSVIPDDYVSLRPSISTLPQEELSQAEKDGLLLMREEEKLARDVYQTLYEKWGLQIFSNIAQSEQTHTEAVRDLLTKYNIPDPVTNDSVGVFQNQDLASLYNTLVTEGEKSEIAALKVGATIEDLDIKDLEDLLLETDNTDINLVYNNLTRGSRNHLRSFTRQLSNRGGAYEAQYITPESYQEIISGSQETGQGQGSKGSGNSTGRNNRGWGNR